MLTDSQAGEAQAGEKDYKLADGNGLYLFVTKAGFKSWRMKYRFGGKEKRLTFGAYPEVSLEEARERRDQARRLLRDQLDPGVERQRARALLEEPLAEAPPVVPSAALVPDLFMASVAEAPLRRGVADAPAGLMPPVTRDDGATAGASLAISAAPELAQPRAGDVPAAQPDRGIEADAGKPDLAPARPGAPAPSPASSHDPSAASPAIASPRGAFVTSSRVAARPISAPMPPAPPVMAGLRPSPERIARPAAAGSDEPPLVEVEPAVDATVVTSREQAMRPHPAPPHGAPSEEPIAASASRGEPAFVDDEPAEAVPFAPDLATGSRALSLLKQAEDAAEAAAVQSRAAKRIALAVLALFALAAAGLIWWLMAGRTQPAASPVGVVHTRAAGLHAAPAQAAAAHPGAAHPPPAHAAVAPPGGIASSTSAGAAGTAPVTGGSGPAATSPQPPTAQPPAAQAGATAAAAPAPRARTSFKAGRHHRRRHRHHRHRRGRHHRSILFPATSRARGPLVRSPSQEIHHEVQVTAPRGAAAIDPALDRAGRAALCLRAAYSADPGCAALRAAGR